MKLLIISLACFLSASALATVAQHHDFRVFLDDQEIGRHNIHIEHKGNVQVITSNANFDVKVLFVTAFKYRHTSTEQWQDNCLVQISSRTQSNRKAIEIQGDANGQTLQIIKNQANDIEPEHLDGCVQSFAYWNPSILHASALLNSQTGDYVDVQVTSLGTESLTVNGQVIETLKYNIKSPTSYAGETVNITLWYGADDMRWLALESPAKSNRVLRYRATDVDVDVDVDQVSSGKIIKHSTHITTDADINTDG